jgi:hypothetical protein
LKNSLNLSWEDRVMARQIFNDLSGTVNQHVSPSLLPSNQFDLLVNCSQEYLGTITNRDGAELLDRVSASNPITGLGAFELSTGVRYLHTVHQGDLYVFNEDTQDFDSQEADVVAAASTVEFASFIGKNYFIGSASDEYLRYATNSGSSTVVQVAVGTVDSGSTGSTLQATTDIFTSGMVGFTIFNTTDGTSRTITAYTSASIVTVDTAINDTWDNDAIEIRMPGKFLAVNGPYLIVAGGGRKAYWSGIEDDTFDVVTDYAVTPREHTGVTSMGNGRAFLLFTRSSYMVVDPTSGDTEEINGFGCVSHRSISVTRGRPIWLGDEGFFMIAADLAYPEEISLLMRNDTTLDAIMNKINSGNLTVTAAGSYKDRYFCAVRDLTGTVKGQTLNDCILEFNVSSMSWKVHTYTQGGLATVFAQFITTGGELGLYAGSQDDGSVYKIANTTATQDDNGAGTAADFNSIIITPHRTFGEAESVEAGAFPKVYFKYKSAATVDVDYATDGQAYTNLVTLPIANTLDFYWAHHVPDIVKAKSLSLKFTFTGAFILYEWGLDVEKSGNTGQKPV